MVNYISAEEILVIHSRVIDATGGSHGVRDIQRISSMVERPQQTFEGKQLYKSLFEKASVYFEVSAYHHPFIDGNKRTAIAIAARFLYINKYELFASNEEIEYFVLQAAKHKYDIAALALWFKQHSKKIR